MHTVLETPRFVADAARLFTDDERMRSSTWFRRIRVAASSFRVAKAFARSESASVDAENAAAHGSYICSAAMTCRYFYWQPLPGTKRTI
jgi:hypothetical protein